MTQYDIFRQQLALNFHAYGHALWEPNPGELYNPVEIGDVGIIREGKFHRIFNILLPKDHPTHENFGTPENHEPLRPRIQRHVDTGVLSPNDFYSGEVKVVTGGLKAFSLRSDGSVQASFMCSRKQGAMLSLPVPARREDTVARGQFGKWMLEHIDRWFAFIQLLDLGIEHMEDIVLVTGWHRTRTYTNVVFLESCESAQVSFNVLVGVSGADVNWQFSREQIRGVVLNCGPSGDNLPENQCVFVRGFRATRFLGIFPTRLQAAAEPSQDPDTYGPRSDKQLISIPSSNSEPLHILLKYIAEKEPNCDMALVHDDDLGCIRGSSLESLDPSTFMDYLRNSQQRTHCHEFSGDGGRSKAGTHVRVAMLTELTFNTSPPIPMVSPIPAASPTPPPGPSTPHDTDLMQTLHGPGSVLADMLLLPPAALTSTTSNLSGQLTKEAPPSSVTGPEHPTTDRRSRDFLTDGYISHTFTPQLAESYLANLCNEDLKTVSAYKHQSGAYVVFNNPSFNSPPALISNERPAWIIDYAVRSGGSVVLQPFFVPRGQGDWPRFVEYGASDMPVFFINVDGTLGVRVVIAAAGVMSLQGANQPVPLGDKPTIKIHVGWPGYPPSVQHVQVRDQTPARTPITLERFVRYLGSQVRQFLIGCEHIPVQGQGPHSQWTVGHDHINVNEVMLIGVVQVWFGNWMPILQLMSRVVP